jgi:hypothetical protein
MYAAGAIAIGMPGCPDLAFCTPSIERQRMVLTHNSSNSDKPGWLVVAPEFISFTAFPFKTL